MNIYYTILYYTVLYYTILYCTIPYYTILYYAILYYTILYYAVLYYSMLYYAILYYIILIYSIFHYMIYYFMLYLGYLPVDASGDAVYQAMLYYTTQNNMLLYHRFIIQLSYYCASIYCNICYPTISYQAVDACSLLLVLFLLHRVLAAERRTYQAQEDSLQELLCLVVLLDFSIWYTTCFISFYISRCFWPSGAQSHAIYNVFVEDSLPALPMALGSLALAALLHANMNGRPLFDTLWMADMNIYIYIYIYYIYTYIHT